MATPSNNYNTPVYAKDTVQQYQGGFPAPQPGYQGFNSPANGAYSQAPGYYPGMPNQPMIVVIQNNTPTPPPNTCCSICCITVLDAIVAFFVFMQPIYILSDGTSKMDTVPRLIFFLVGIFHLTAVYSSCTLKKALSVLILDIYKWYRMLTLFVYVVVTMVIAGTVHLIVTTATEAAKVFTLFGFPMSKTLVDAFRALSYFIPAVFAVLCLVSIWMQCNLHSNLNHQRHLLEVEEQKELNHKMANPALDNSIM